MAIVTVIPSTFTAPGLPTLGVLGFTDTFTRPDADELGHTEGMPRLPWKLWGNSDMEARIRNGEAEFARLTAGPCVAVADAKTPDVDIECTLGAINGSQSGVAFRAVSHAAYWSLRQVSGSHYALYLTESGNNNAVQTSNAVIPAAGDRLRVVASGESIECFVNGQSIITHTSAQNADATHHGLYTSNGIGLNSWRDVKVTAA